MGNIRDAPRVISTQVNIGGYLMSVSAIKSTPAVPLAAAPSLKAKKKIHTAKVPTAKSAPATPVKQSGAAASTSIGVKA
jgi:hypothetical protein